MYRELPNLYLFAKVAETLSIRDAAKQLHLARSTVSKRLARFESELGVKLFNRTTRRMSLTESGRRLYQQWREVSQSVDAALATVRGADQHPHGTLLVHMPSCLGSALMPHLMGEFRELCPELKLRIAFGDNEVDMIGEGFDVVIRVAQRLPDSRLVAKKLASSPRILAASPGYLERQGRPKRLEDLRQHHCLALGARSDRRVIWGFETSNGPADVTVNPVFAANNNLAIVLAACLDVGILYLPQILIANEVLLERLQPVALEKCKSPAYGLYAVYPKGDPAAKVRAFVDFVAAKIDMLTNTDRWAPLMHNRDRS